MLMRDAKGKQYRLLAHCSRDGRYLVVAEVHDDEILRLEQLLWNLAEVIVAHVLVGGGWGREEEGYLKRQLFYRGRLCTACVVSTH